MGARQPVRIQPHTRVDRWLASPQRVEVGTIGGEAGRYLGTFGNRTVAGDHDVHVPGGLFQPLSQHQLTLSGVYTEELRESLEQFQVALQDGDHALLHGLGRG